MEGDKTVQGPPTHELESNWTFWYDKKLQVEKRLYLSSQDYQNNLRQLSTFGTVEDFWRNYVHLKRPKVLDRDVNIYLFREGLVPMWESFPDGGCWILKVKKARSGVLGKIWQDLLFALIGESFAEPGVVGVMQAVRTKEILFSVWHSDSSNDLVRMQIGKQLKAVLNLESDTVIEYKRFQQSLVDQSSFSNAEQYVFTKPAEQKGKGGQQQQQKRGKGKRKGRSRSGSQSKKKAAPKPAEKEEKESTSEEKK